MTVQIQTSTSTPIVNMMKEDLADKIFIHMNLSSPELQIFALKTKALNGKYLRLNFQVAGNSRLEARGEDVPLPGQDPSAALQDRVAGLNIQELRFNRRQVYTAVDFTGPMAAAVKSKEGGYENIMEFRFKDTERHMVERVGIKLAYGALGILGKIKDVSTHRADTGVVTLYAADETASLNPVSAWGGNRLIRPGMVLSATPALTGSTSTVRTGTNDQARIVSDRSKDNSAPTVTFAVDGTSSLAGNAWTAGDYLISHGERQTTAINSVSDAQNGLYGPLGIMDMVDDGTLFPYYGNIDRTLYESLQCQRLGNSGTLRAITLDLINLACEQSEVAADGKPDVIYCTPAIRRQLVKFLTATVAVTAAAGVAGENPTRYNNPGAEKVTIGVNKFDVLTLGPTGRMTIMSSRLAPQHMVFLIQRDTAILMQDGPPTFMDNDGLKVRQIQGKDSWQSFWRWYVPGVIGKENWKNVRIDDVTGSLLA